MSAASTYKRDAVTRKGHILLFLALLTILSSFASTTRSALAEETQSDSQLAFHRARDLFDNGKTSEALAAFQKIEDECSLSSFVPQAIYFEGCCLAAQHHEQQAADTFARLVANYPRSAVASDATLKETECRRKLEVLQKQPRPDSTPIVFFQAENFFNSGKYREALGLFQKCAATGQDRSLLEKSNFRIASCYYYLRDFGAALSNFAAFTKNFPDSAFVPDALFFIGRCHSILSRSSTDPQAIQTNLTAAVGNYELIRSKYPTNELPPEVTFQLGYLYAYLGAYDSKNYNKAADAFQEFINRWPNHRLVPEAFYQLAHVRAAQTQFDAAITAFQELIDKYPDNDLTPSASYELAGCYARQNQPTQATAALLDFLKRYPNHGHAADAFYAVASQFKNSGSPTSFHNALDRLASQYPNNTNEQVAADTVAIEYALEHDDIQQACALASRLLTGPAKDHLPVVSNLAAGDALLRHGQFAQAHDLYRQTLALDSGSADTMTRAQLGLAEANLGLHRLDAAEDLFSKVLATNPRGPAHVSAQLGLAEAYFAKGRNAAPEDISNIKAISLLNETLTNSDHQAAGEASFMLGDYFFNLPDNKKENAKAALAYFQRAASLTSGPQGEEAVFCIGECYQFLGSPSGARGAFETYLRLFPNGKLASEARQKLASLPAISPADSSLTPILVAARSDGPDAGPRGFEFENELVSGANNFPSPGDTPKNYPSHIFTTSADKPVDLSAKVISGVNQTAAATPNAPTWEISVPSAAAMTDKAESPGRDMFAAHSGPPSDAAERAVVAALRWLKANQEKDGSWKCGQSAPAGTALATLAFLRHGETPDSPEFGQTVTKGLRYLAQHVDTNGFINGVSEDYIGYGYSQGPVVLALAEGYAITRSRILREPLERALQAVFREQIAPKDRAQDIGGWRNQSQTRDSDVTVTGWMVLALKSAQAAGIEIPQPVFDKASQYLWSMYDTKNPGFGYQNPERYPTTTAIGVLSQQFLGNAGDPRIKASLDYLHDQKVDWEKSAGDFVLYGWYCMTQAMFRGGSPYREYWSDQIQDTLVKNQQSDGHWLPPPHSNSEVRDLARTPAYSTALGALILEVY